MPSREFEVKIKPMVDQGALANTKNKIKDGIEGDPVELKLGTKEIHKQLKEIAGAVKGIQGVMNSGFSIKGTKEVNESFNSMISTIEKLDGKLEELFKDGKQAGSVVDIGDIKLADEQIDALGRSLKEIQSTLSQIKNSKNSIGIKNEIQETRNQIDRASDSLDLFWSKMKGKFKVNLTSDNTFTKQLGLFMSDVKNGFKGGLDELGFDKLTRARGEYNNLFKNIMGYVSGGGNLSQEVKYLDEGVEKVTTIRNILREINNMYQGTSISKRMMIGARNGYNLGIFDALSEVSQADAKLQELNRELEITENREGALFDKDTASRLATVIDKINELLTATGGIEKLAESFNELNNVILKLSNILSASGTNALSKAATATSKKVKSFEDEGLSIARKIEKLTQERLSLGANKLSMGAKGLESSNTYARMQIIDKEREALNEQYIALYAKNGMDREQAEEALSLTLQRIKAEDKLTQGIKEEETALKAKNKAELDQQKAIEKSIERNARKKQRKQEQEEAKQVRDLKKEILSIDKEIFNLEKNYSNAVGPHGLSGGKIDYYEQEKKKLSLKRSWLSNNLKGLISDDEYTAFVEQSRTARSKMHSNLNNKKQQALDEGKNKLYEDLRELQEQLDKLRSNDSFSYIEKDIESADGALKILTQDVHQLSSFQDLDKSKQEFRELKETVDSLTGQTKEASKINTKFDGLVGDIDKISAAERYTKEFSNALEEARANILSLQGSASSVEELRNNFERAEQQVKELKLSAKDLNNVLADTGNVSKLNLKIEKFVSDNSRLGSKMREQFSNLQIKLQGADVTQQELKNITNEFIRLEAQAYKTGQIGKSMFDTLRGRIRQMSTNFVAMYFSFYDIIRYIRQAVTAVTEIDSAMTELRKVSDASQTRIARDFEISAKAAQDLGSTIKDVINITADWSRLGYSISDAEELARVTTMFKAVGDNMTAESASEAMISTLKAYDIEVDKAQSVLDKYNSVANNFAIDTQGLAESLSRSGAALHAAGNEISESMGLIVAANDSLQDPSSVGQMLKTISMRLRGASVADLEELGIDTTGMTQGKKSVVQQFKAQAGIDIMEGTSYKSTFQILDELHKKWADLNDAERAAITEAVGGKRGGSVMSSLMTNWEDARKAVETAENSAGSAEQEMSHKMESIDYSIQRVKASAEELAHDALSSDFVKNAIEFGNSFLQVLDKIIEDMGMLPTLIGTIGAAYAALHVDRIVSSIGSFVARGNGIASIAGAVSANLGGASAIGTVEDLMANPLIKNMETANILSYISKSGGNKELAEQVLIYRNIAESEREAMLAANGFIVAEEGAVVSGQKVNGLKAMWIGLADAIGISTTALTTLAGGIAVLGLLIKAGYDAKKGVDDLRKSSQNFADNFNSAKSEIEDYKEEIKSLNETINDSNTSYEDSKAARERLYEIQSSLIQNYGTERESIEMITKAIEGESDALDELTRKQWQRQKNEFERQNIEGKADWWVKLANNASSKIELMLNQIEGKEGNGIAVDLLANADIEHQKDLEFYQKMADRLGQTFEVNKELFTGTLQLKGNAYEVLDMLEEIQVEAEKAGNSIDEGILTSIQKEIKSLSEITSEWQDFYDTYVLNERILGTVYEDNYKNYLKDVKAYQNAITDPDRTEESVRAATEAVRDRYNELKDELEKDQTISPAIRESILDAFDGIAPEIQNKIGIVEIETILTTNDPKRGIVPITGTDGVSLRSIVDSVKDNFDYTEEILNFQEAGATQGQKDSYRYLEAAARQYNVSLEEMVNLLKERNELESHADNEYVEKMQGAYRILSQMGGMSSGDYNDFIEGLTKEDWLDAGNHIQDFISKLGLVDDTASKITPTFDEAKQSVDEFLSGTDDVPSELEVVKSVLADVKNVSQETYSSLISLSSKYGSALTIQNGRLTVNRNKLLAIANMRAKERQQTLKQATAYKKLELLKRYKELKAYDIQLKETTTDTYEQVIALQEEITQLDLLSNSLEQATDAFDRFKEAQETADSPYYETSREAYQTIEDALDSGFVGTDDVKMAQQLLYSAEYYKKFVDAAKDGYAAQSEIAEQWQKDHAKYNTEDDFQNVKNFYDELQKSGLMENGQLAASSVIGEYFNASADWTNSMIEKLNLLDWDGEVIKQAPVDFIDDATQAVTNLADARLSLSEAMQGDADTNLLTGLEENLDKATSYYESFMERIPETFATAKEKIDSGMSLSEAFYGKDGMSDVKQHNLAAFLTTIGMRIDETKDKIKKLNDETNDSFINPDSDVGKELAKLTKEQEQLQEIQNTLQHGLYNERKDGMADRVSRAQSLQNQLASAQERLRKAKSGYDTSTNIEQTEQQVAALKVALDSLVDENYKISLELDKTAIDAQISALKSELGDLRQTKVSMSGSTAAQEAVQSAINAKNAQVEDLEGQKADIERVLNFEVTGMEDVESAQGTIESIEDKNVTVTANAVDNGVGALKLKIDALKDKTITITANAKQNGNLSDNGFPSSRSPVDGTAHADGEWGLQSNEPKALVGELGPEGLVRDGRFYLIGKQGPERRNLKKGDVIFNHKQTEELLKNGYATKRGTLIGGSFVDGTLIGTAHLNDQVNYDYDEWTFRKRGSTAKSIQKAAKETTDEIKDDIDEVEEGAEEATENFIDWIERQIKHFTTYTERYLNQAQKALDRVTNNYYSGQTKGIKNAVKAYKVFDKTVDSLYKTASRNQKSLMETQNAAYIAYTNLTNAVGLDPEYQNRIKYGMMEIENVTDETLKDQITKWQDFYDKSQESIDAFIEAADKFYHMPIDKAAQKIENLSAKIEYLGKVIDNKTNYRDRNAVIDEQATQQELILKADKKAKKQTEKNRKKVAKQAKKEIMKEANADIKDAKAEVKTKKNLNKVSKKAKKEIKEATKKTRAIDLSQLKEGTKAYKAAEKYNKALSNKQDKKQTISTKNVFNLADFQQGTPAYDAVIKYNAAVNASTEAWNKFQNTYEETMHKIKVEYPKAEFDNIARDFTKTVEMMNHDFQDYDNQINLLTKAGRKVSAEYYKAQKDINEEKLKEYTTVKKGERDMLEARLNSIQKYSDEWYDAYNAIKEIDNQIAQLTQTTMELNKAITQLVIDAKEGIHDDLSWLSEEFDLFKSLLSYADKTSDKTGLFTDEGETILGIDAAKANIVKEQYENAIEYEQKLDYMANNNLLEYQGIIANSKEELQQYQKDAHKTTMSLVKERYESENELWEMMKEQLQAELKMYQDLTDERKESLNAEKDLYEYQKKIADKTKNIALLEKQLAAYRGDTSQEGQAKRQKLQKELTSAQEDLRDTEYDRYISDQQKMLDDMMEEYSDKVETLSKNRDYLIELAYKEVEKQGEQLVAKLDDLAEKNSYDPIKMNEILIGADGAVNAFSKYLGNDGTVIAAIKEANAPSKEFEDAIKEVLGKSATENAEGNNPIAEPKSGGSASTATKTPEQKVGEVAAATEAIIDQLANLNAQTNLENAVMKANAPKDASSIKKDAEKYIKEHAKAGRANKNGKFGEVNQHISEFMGTKGKAADKQKVLTTNELSELAEIVGASYKKGGDTTEFIKALKKYHVAGFARGGLVEAIKRNGDDGIATLKVGEAILTPTDSKNLASLAQHFEAIDVTADIMNMLKESAKSGNVFGTPQSIDYGGVNFNFDLPNVTDPNSFINAIKTDNRVQKAIQSVSIDRINNGGRLSVQRIK